MDHNCPKVVETLSKISKISKYDHINPPKELSSEAVTVNNLHLGKT